jgi:hypothetical protein
VIEKGMHLTHPLGFDWLIHPPFSSQLNPENKDMIENIMRAANTSPNKKIALEELSSFLDLDRAASLGIADPTLLKNTLKATHEATDYRTFKKVYEHPGMHPYRIILDYMREKLMR